MICVSLIIVDQSNERPVRKIIGGLVKEDIEEIEGQRISASEKITEIEEVVVEEPGENIENIKEEPVEKTKDNDNQEENHPYSQEPSGD